MKCCRSAARNLKQKPLIILSSYSLIRRHLCESIQRNNQLKTQTDKLAPLEKKYEERDFLLCLTLYLYNFFFVFCFSFLYFFLICVFSCILFFHFLFCFFFFYFVFNSFKFIFLKNNSFPRSQLFFFFYCFFCFLFLFPSNAFSYF